MVETISAPRLLITSFIISEMNYLESEYQLIEGCAENLRIQCGSQMRKQLSVWSGHRQITNVCLREGRLIQDEIYLSQECSNILWLFEQLLGHFQFLGEFGSQTVIVALQSTFYGIVLTGLSILVSMFANF